MPDTQCYVYVIKVPYEAPEDYEQYQEDVAKKVLGQAMFDFMMRSATPVVFWVEKLVPESISSTYRKEYALQLNARNTTYVDLRIPNLASPLIEKRRPMNFWERLKFLFVGK